ncbi:MAG TPA: 50S ribosomal protein L1, partial [Candidatus Baltobacteraceae bacterium]
GTVSANIGNAVRDIKAGKVEYRLDKAGIVHTIVGKASFEEGKLAENIATLIDAIVRAKPAAAKGTYLRSITLTSTMGPGIKVDPGRIKAAAG